jgi:hypothetical protein
VMRAFEEFFARAHRFQPLQMSEEHTGFPASSSSSITMTTTSASRKRKNIILIEDLPPVSAPTSRKIFQDTLSKFALSGGGRSSAVLVIIISDVFSKQSTELLFSSSKENRDFELTIRTLLPANLLSKIDSGGRHSSNIMQIKYADSCVAFSG